MDIWLIISLALCDVCCAGLYAVSRKKNIPAVLPDNLPDRPICMEHSHGGE